MMGKMQKSMKLTFMPVPLTAGEKRAIYRRLSEREPVVFVEASALTEPLVFVNSTFTKEQPDVTFGFSSTQRRQKTGCKQSEAAVSHNCSASSKEGAPRCPINNRMMKKVPAKREYEDKTPSEEENQQVKPQDLISCVKSLINRLTPETFQDSVAQPKELELETEKSLQEVISIIFERAVLRPNSALCANMCHCVSKIQVSTTADPAASVSFQTLLIRHCRAEFEHNHGRDDFSERSRGQLETAKDEEELEQLKKELDDAKASCRSVKNIKFIGELFKSEILSCTAASRHC
ncbi:eukaryotic translation initiation factor 4 gamma 1-like [Trachinotus anak]|uniref:eukaryotic translation initiation factor 4 gamma 1-like n=1 Tax=Trachinotus anak TaxID=443729 RepID=UPI0039F2112B